MIQEQIAKKVTTSFFATYFVDVQFAEGRLINFEDNALAGIQDNLGNYFYIRTVNDAQPTDERIDCSTETFEEGLRLVAIGHNTSKNSLLGFVYNNLKASFHRLEIEKVTTDYDKIWKDEMPNEKTRRNENIQVIAIDFSVKYNLKDVISTNPCDYEACIDSPVCPVGTIFINEDGKITVGSGGTFDLSIVDSNDIPQGVLQPDGKTVVVPSAACPSITVAISGSVTPNQFESTEYTAALTGVNGASTDPANYSFMWIVKDASNNTVFAQGVNGVNTIDISLDKAGAHTITVTVSGEGLSTDDSYAVTVQAGELMLDIVPPTNTFFSFGFKKLKADWAGHNSTVRRADGQVTSIGFNGEDTSRNQLNAFRNGSELSIVTSINQYTVGRDAYALDNLVANEYFLTDGAGALNQDADGDLFIIPSQNGGRMGWNFRGSSTLNGVDGLIKGTFFAVVDMVENGAGSSLNLFYEAPYFSKRTANNTYFWGKTNSSGVAYYRSVLIPTLPNSGVQLITIILNPSGTDSELWVGNTLVDSGSFPNQDFEGFPDMIGATWNKPVYDIRNYHETLSPANRQLCWNEIQRQFPDKNLGV